MDKQLLEDQLELIYNSFVHTGYSQKDLLEVMDDRDDWRERELGRSVRDA